MINQSTAALASSPSAASVPSRSQSTRPSQLSSVEAQSFARTQPFTKLGHWGQTAWVARRGSGLRLVKWMARHRSTAETYEALWQACRQANRDCFAEYRTIHLRVPSFFLPAGEVVFEVTTSPTQIPDHPPRGVAMRHLEALDLFPGAKFYFLRPVFVADPQQRLYTVGDLAEDVEIDREEAIFAAWMYGWAFRTVDLARRRAFDAVRIGVQTVTKAVEKLNYLLEPVERRRIIRLARARDALLRRNDLDRLADKADQWGMELEAQQLRRAISELRYSFDPILCFEVADRPGQLWFEAHWFEAQDGRTYVHY